YAAERVEVDLVSGVHLTQREALMQGRDQYARLTLRHHVADRTVASGIEPFEPTTYDNIVIMSSERQKTALEADADTIVTYLILRDMLASPPANGQAGPRVLIELMDPTNRKLFADQPVEVTVTP